MYAVVVGLISPLGGSVSREWKLTAEGTRYTEGFATFLKGLLGFIPDYGSLS